MRRLVKLLVSSEFVQTGGGDGMTRYRYYVEERGLFLYLGKTEKFNENKEINEWTSKTQDTLNTIITVITDEQPHDFKVYKQHLGNIGNAIAEKFIPEKVMQFIRDLSDDEPHYVYINSESHWLPWELIYDNDDIDAPFFWGEKCIIVRVPMLEFKRRHSKRSVLAPNKRSLTSVVNVVGDQVADELEVEDKTRLALGLFANKVTGFDGNYDNGNWEARTVSDVQNRGSDASILHFTCHGVNDELVGFHLQLNSTATDLMNYQLDILTVGTHLRIDDALVFVNACSSAVVAEEYGIFLNLAQQFFESGSGTVIGTIAPVPIVQAVRLADEFYKEILSGESVGISLYKAKKVMKEEENPFYLFYCIYGNAYRRFKTADD